MPPERIAGETLWCITDAVFASPQANTASFFGPG